MVDASVLTLRSGLDFKPSSVQNENMKQNSLPIPFLLTSILICVSSSLTRADTPKTVASVMASAKESDWRPVNPENTLYFELPAGRVIIELNPDYAPESVANIKALAKEKYWDGLAIVRVQDNYVVQWADPAAEKHPEAMKKIMMAKTKLPAELEVALNPKASFDSFPEKDLYAKEVGFSNGFTVGRDKAAKKLWGLHCYGAVGVGRDNAPDSGNGTELYAVIGNAPRVLDRNVTVVGRVLQGMEYLSSLPRGHGPLGFYEKEEQNVPIRVIHLASDMPAKERTNLEVLKTDTPLFKALIEARKNRKEDWFQYRAGHIDVCSVTVPVREVKTESK